MMEQTKRQMDGVEWAWLVIFMHYRAIYLANGGWALVGAIVLNLIPVLNIVVFGWGIYAMHQVFGCKTSTIALGVWVGLGLLVFAIGFLTG